MFRDTSMDYLSRDEVLEIWNNNMRLTDEQLLAMDETEFRARVRERSHHTLEIQVYATAYRHQKLKPNQADYTKHLLELWEKRGLGNTAAHRISPSTLSPNPAILPFFTASTSPVVSSAFPASQEYVAAPASSFPVSSSVFGFLPTISTLFPSCNNSLAAALPMPRLPPMITIFMRRSPSS